MLLLSSASDARQMCVNKIVYSEHLTRLILLISFILHCTASVRQYFSFFKDYRDKNEVVWSQQRRTSRVVTMYHLFISYRLSLCFHMLTILSTT